MMLILLLDFSNCFPETEPLSPLLFKDNGLNSGDTGIAVAQNELELELELVENFMEVADSASGSKTMDVSVRASIDINSTQWSLTT